MKLIIQNLPNEGEREFDLVIKEVSTRAHRENGNLSALPLTTYEPSASVSPSVKWGGSMR